MAIAQPSVQSLYLMPSANGHQLSTATGFVVMHEGAPYLITNWHVVSGRNPENGQPLHKSGATPTELHLMYLRPVVGTQLNWEPRIESLIDADGNALWLEHPVHGRRVDAVALPLTQTNGFLVLPHDLGANVPDIRAVVSDMVNVVGFPFGVSAGGAVAVWTKAGIASEPEVNFDGLPCLLIDARTRQGQSGSPVIAYSPGGGTAMADGSTAFYGGPVCKLLGVYSGRIRDDSDLGKVWRTDAIREILNGANRGNGSLLP